MVSIVFYAVGAGSGRRTGHSSDSSLNPAVKSKSFAFLMAIITHCAVVMCCTLTVWELAAVHLCLMCYSYRLRALIKHCSAVISSFKVFCLLCIFLTPTLEQNFKRL